MIEFFTPIASTLIGIGGAWLQRKHERKQFKNETERMMLVNEHEIKLTELQMRASREETEQDIALAETQGNIDAFMASQNAAAQLSNIKWGQSKLGDIANFMRAVTRPAITWYLVVNTSWMAHKTHKIMEAVLGNSNSMALTAATYETLMANPLYVVQINLTSMCLGWWFGSRGKATSYKDEHYNRSAAVSF